MKHKYSVHIAWSQEDNAFIASVPELPGCMADGPTQQKAIKNLDVIISEWVETATELGREIPQPVHVTRPRDKARPLRARQSRAASASLPHAARSL